MVIRRRINKPKKLPYHRLVGSLDLPPLAEVVERNFDAVSREPYCHHGGRVITTQNIGPPEDRPRTPKGLGRYPTTLILGVMRNHWNERGGIGPGQGYSVWVAKEIIAQRIVERRSPFHFVRDLVALRDGKATPISSVRDSLRFVKRLKPKKPFPPTDWPRSRAELNMETEAFDTILVEYTDMHDIDLTPWFD